MNAVKNPNSENLPQQSVEITRVFDATREQVFDAWIDPAQMAQWWGPRGFSNPVCEMDTRVGGSLRIVMRSPDGIDYPMTGVFEEITRPSRLVFTSVARDAQGNAHLEAHTQVDFTDEGGKTRVSVHASAKGLTSVSAQMLAGMQAGWSQSLDKLDEFVVGTTERQFVVERNFDAPRELVWKAWTKSEHVAQWWGPNGFTNTFERFELKTCGVWQFVMHGPDGTDYPNRIDFIEVVPAQRLLYRHTGAEADPRHVFMVTVDFESCGADKSLVRMRAVFTSREIRDEVVEKYGALEGGKQNLARLAAYVDRTS